MNKRCLLLMAVLSALTVFLGCGGAADVVPSQLAALNPRVLTDAESVIARGMLRAEIRMRTSQICRREEEAWAKVRSVADWEKFRDSRLAALRRSLGGALAWADNRAGAAAPQVEVTGTIAGEGFRIQNLVIAGRPALPISANLYLPDPVPAGAMPAILICTSHHNGKTQGELLDMGMTWARSGCVVLVMDNLGYNERRQHPDSFVPREDYRWRYYLGMQLYTVSESLIGWMVDDLHRGIDVLLAQPGVDQNRVIAIGSVAGGGDPVAVLAAFDRRIRCVIPFNFGSAHVRRPTTQGEAEWVNYVGGGDFETTRCLRNCGRDGFVPWVLVAAAAPRCLIFAKEFAWDAAADAGFACISRAYELHGARDRLDSIHGYGRGDQSAAEASHCSNVGPVHRKGIYPTLQRWMNMPVPQSFKPTTRPSYESLACMTPEVKPKFPQRKVHEIAAEMAARRLAAVRDELAALSPADRRAKLRKEWSRVLGNCIEPPGVPEVKRSERSAAGSIAVEKVLLAAEPGIVIPILLLRKSGPATGRQPVVVCVAQGGKAAFLAKRTAEIAELLNRGLAVCLVDVRGTGETKPAGGRYWCEQVVEIAAEELMTGRTMLGSRLRDLRGVLRYLQSRADLGGRRIAVWGDSFADMNPPDYVDPPLQTKLPNELAEPLGANLALLAALFENSVQAVLARGGLVSFASVLDGPACHVTLDDIVPQVLEAGDLDDVAAVLAPTPLRIEAAVDGRNRLADGERLKGGYGRAAAAYAARPGRLGLSPTPSRDAADWLSGVLSGR